MNEKSIAKIACRVIAIYIIIKGIEYISYFFSMSLQPNFGQGFDRNMMFQMIFGSILPSVIIIILGIILWVKATKISDYMIDDVDIEANKTIINVYELQSAAFSVVGLMILVKLIPEISNLIPRLAYFTGEYIPKETIVWLEIKVSIIGMIIKFIIGLLLLFKSRGLVGFIKRLQKAGLKDLE